MPTTPSTPPTNATGLSDAEQTKAALKSAAKSAERSLLEATDQAREKLTEAAARTEAAVREGIETLRAQSRAYADTASEQFDVASQYVVDRVKERPVTATLAGLGVGLLIGLLLAGRSDRR